MTKSNILITIQRSYHFILYAMGAREVYSCPTTDEVDDYLSQGGYTLIIAEEGDIQRWANKPPVKTYSYEFIVQTLILGCLPDRL